MWCGYIYCSTGFDMTLKHKREWVHLNIHLQQARTHYVTWLGYYLSYWIDTFLGLLWTGSLVGGRLTGKWECEAYARENDPDYLYNYQYERIRRYTFTLPERRQLWNNIKGNSERWTELLKKL